MADDLKAAESAVAEAETALVEAQDKAAAAQKELAAAQAARDAAVVARDGPRHRHQDQIDRMAYIKRQAEVRAERAGKSRAVLDKLGAEVGDIDPRAPIDAAMSRKSKRGTQRPAIKAANQ